MTSSNPIPYAKPHRLKLGALVGLTAIAAVMTSSLPFQANAQSVAPSQSDTGLTTNMRETTDAAFASDVLRQRGWTVLEVAAVWCPWCQQMAPVMQDVATANTGKILFFRADYDSNPGLSSHYASNGIPSLTLFYNGRVVATNLGYMSAGDVQTWLDQSMRTPQFIPQASGQLQP